MIYLLRGYQRIEDDGFLGTSKPEWWTPRRFESLAEAKEYADSRIHTLAPGEPVVLEVEERSGPRSRTGRIKYRVERDAQGCVEYTPLV
jgi:hypothetical protein